jgi:hypothetical protein
VFGLLGKYKGKKLLFKDSIAMIGKALKYFLSIFNFPEIKEIDPYRYSDVMMSKGELYLRNKIYALEYISNDNQNTFILNVSKLNGPNYNFDREKIVYIISKEMDNY